MTLEARDAQRRVEDLPEALKLTDHDQYVEDVRVGLQEMRVGKTRDFAESLREIRAELDLHGDQHKSC